MSTWLGPWPWGVNFAGDAERVVAVRVGDGDIKYGLDWIGPVLLTEDTEPLLEAWAQEALDISGGYVHLFSADGDGGTEELRRWAAERADDDAEDDE